MLIFVISAAMFFWLAFFVEPRESSGRSAWLTWLNAQSGGLLFLLGFGACGVWATYFLRLSIWQFFVDAPFVAISRNEITFHRSFPRAPAPIPFASVQRVLFARSDKLPASHADQIALSMPGAWGVRMATKCRSGLRIYYRIGNTDKHITIYDGFVDGGEIALLKFGATLRKTLKSQGLLSNAA